MIRVLKGVIFLVGSSFFVIEVGGVGFKVFASAKVIKWAAAHMNEEGVRFYSYLHIKEGGMDLYGFQTEEDLDFFELLNTVSGVGPRSALAILDVAKISDLVAAIKGGRPDLLTGAAGIGQRIAERIVVELRNKVKSSDVSAGLGRMDGDEDVVEALVGLGYKKDKARAALSAVGGDVINLEDRLKAALKILSKK